MNKNLYWIRLSQATAYYMIKMQSRSCGKSEALRRLAIRRAALVLELLGKDKRKWKIPMLVSTRIIKECLQ